MSLNDNILNTALLGTATRELQETALPEELKETFRDIKEKAEDAEAAFYQQAALGFAWSRAGVEPQQADDYTAIKEADTDETGYFLREAGELLLLLIAERYRYLLLYAYRRAATCGKLILPNYLQAIVSHAFERNNPFRNEEQQHLPSLTGNRGRWLLPLMGGTLKNGFEVSPKYIGSRRLMEIAVATLVTDRALLLYGLPGTAKSWVSEHLAAAISGNSTLIVQGTAGTGEEAIRYGWNYARLLAEGPCEGALVQTPIMKAMQEGKIGRIEELTRIGSDVQDALITILSEKTLPIPELNQEIQAIRGFNIIATANNRDKGVNDLSSALKRRFNTVILPLPDTMDEEVDIVRRRVDSFEKTMQLPAEKPALEEIRRVVTIFRELRQGVTGDGKTKLKTPSGTLSTAEAISVVNSGLAMAGYFGDGQLHADDLVSGIHLLGIRHHGPGSCRNVLRCLEELKPDLILVEGPAEAEALLSCVTDPQMQPPVALLGYQPDDPQNAVFYPFAEFSPEWQAMRYARLNEVAFRFFDLPLMYSMALKKQEASTPEIATEADMPESTEEAILPETDEAVLGDPFDYLATVAGYPDGESWWDAMVEHRNDVTDLFQAVEEAVTALREELPGHTSRRDLLREAWMRKMVRAAEKEESGCIVVICGAWHVPALRNMPKVKEDNERLKGLPKVKIECTWIPWTYDRLSFRSGYGAGIESPGWYQYLWDQPEDDGTRWVSRVAALLRGKSMDISVAHVIETVRLAQATAALRGLPHPSLAEFNEAITTVMGFGDDILLQIVREELVISNRLGQVPDVVPKVPTGRFRGIRMARGHLRRNGRFTINRNKLSALSNGLSMGIP